MNNDKVAYCSFTHVRVFFSMRKNIPLSQFGYSDVIIVQAKNIPTHFFLGRKGY